MVRHCGHVRGFSGFTEPLVHVADIQHLCAAGGCVVVHGFCRAYEGIFLA